MDSTCGENVSPPSPSPSEVPLPSSQQSSIRSCASQAASECCSILSVSTATWQRQEQEAQDRFNERIEQLCQDLWPQPQSIKSRILSSQTAARLRTNSIFRRFVPDFETPLIRHLNGGGFNHITAVKLPLSCGKEGGRDLIIRVPREDESRPDYQVATLDFVRSRTAIPVPTIAATDFTGNNALGKPYVVQHRIPGVDLESVWDTLSHAQRCVVAKEVGQVVSSLLAVESPVPGVIEAGSLDTNIPTGPANIVPWKLELRDGTLSEVGPKHAIADHASEKTSRTLHFFTSYLSAWRDATLAKNLGEADDEVKLWDGLLNMAQDMDNMGLFQPDIFCLCHLDLHNLRNIMVRIQPDHTLEVTGILDWDEAVIAPKVVNCQPPGWLWGYDKDTYVDENELLPWPYELEGANKQPASAEQRELKSIFESHAGFEYPRLAYDASSRCMRTMFRIATDGLNTSWHFHAAERILKERDDLYSSLFIGS